MSHSGGISKVFTNVYFIWSVVVIVFVMNFVSVFFEYMMPLPKMAEAGKDVSETGLWTDARSFNKFNMSSEEHALMYKAVAKVDLHQDTSIVGNISGRSILSKQPTFDERHIKGSNHSDANAKQRPYMCDGCFHTHFKFESSNICDKKAGSDRVDVIILITSARDHYRNRMTLRRTWLTHTKNNTANVRYAFILGNPKTGVKNTNITLEQRTYKDIVIANFTDDYMNLTFKTLAAFKWVQEECKHARFVLKTDDDMYIDVDALISLTNKYHTSLTQTMFGACWDRKPIRFNVSKYYVSNSSYPNETYPNVCSGTAYLTGSNIINKILTMSSNVPFFPLEDVYVGFCLHLLGIKPKRYNGFIAWTIKKEVYLKACASNRIISIHARSAAFIGILWNLKCKKQTIFNRNNAFLENKKHNFRVK